MGDFLQLPPVTTPEERSILQALKYRSPYAFSARLLDVPAKVVELEQVYRQPETEFIDILAKIRTAEDFHSAIRVLNDRYAGPNAMMRCLTAASDPLTQRCPGSFFAAITLAPTFNSNLSGTGS